MLPILIGVSLLTGLLLEFLPAERLSGWFGRNDVLDALTGATFGSIAAGQPLTGYVLGGELLANGISLVAVTALLVSWVTVQQLVHTIAHRVGRYLERQGFLERDMENSYLASDAVDDDPMAPLLGHSITYRIAIGSQAVIERGLVREIGTSPQDPGRRYFRTG